MPTPPTIAQVKAYLATAGASYPDSDIEDEMGSETAAQARVCRIPADPNPGDPQPYPKDLAKALLRRIARALEMRAKPLGYQANIEGVLSYISANDPEIRRLEAPFRKLVVG